MEASSGREVAEAVPVTASRRICGASVLVVQAAKSARYWRSASVRPESREKVSVAELVEVEPGKARSIAAFACAEGADAGRNEAWSVAPCPASDGASLADRIIPTIHTRTIR